MDKRPIIKTRPGLEPLEEKHLLSAGASSSPHAKSAVEARTVASQPAAHSLTDANAAKPNTAFLVYRITNPNLFNNHLTPPFNHVLVQAAQPVPGQVYNVLSITVRNGTAQTFDASSGFTVKASGQANTTPILTGNEQWKPGQVIVFYLLSKKYYPLPNVVTDGFIFDLGARSVAVPGPSGIFLRLTYKPATFDRTLDSIVAFGPGSEGGSGIKYGLPVTSLYEFVSAKTNRIDFGGLF